MTALGTFIDGLRESSWRSTAPVGVGPQPDFLNGIVTGQTAVSARELLDRLLTIEQELVGCARIRGRRERSTSI